MIFLVKPKKAESKNGVTRSWGKEKGGALGQGARCQLRGKSKPGDLT